MAFLKRCLISFGALFFIFWGGMGTQSPNTAIQGLGALCLLVGLLFVYIFARMFWRVLGCLPSLIIFSGIALFILYAMGFFADGSGQIIPKIKEIIGYGDGQSQSALRAEGVSVQDKNTIANIGGLDSELSQKEVLQNKVKTPEAKNHMQKLPTIRAVARVLNGDTLMFSGKYFRLFGVDAPEPNQSCLDYRGRSYHCGKQAAQWLKDWIEGYYLDCKIMQTDSQGNMFGVCSLGDYDVGAALVNAGWAIALLEQSGIYAPYQVQAQQNKRGLWSGEFYAPKDWRAMQNKKGRIKIIKKKTKRRVCFGKKTRVFFGF